MLVLVEHVPNQIGSSDDTGYFAILIDYRKGMKLFFSKNFGYVPDRLCCLNNPWFVRHYLRDSEHGQNSFIRFFLSFKKRAESKSADVGAADHTYYVAILDNWYVPDFFLVDQAYYLPQVVLG